MQAIRTDLALEARELCLERAGRAAELPGVTCAERRQQGIPVTAVRVLNDAGARALGKPPGTYLTLTLDAVARREEDSFRRSVHAVSAELRGLLSDVPDDRTVLVAGLGNRAITPDAVGPEVHRNLLVTRHLVRQVPEHFGALRPVAALEAEVLGNTGMESGRVVQAVCRWLRPACVIVVDALAARSVSRLCRTIQLSDTGITPGSGVGNHRVVLDRETLGAPVLSVGVPTVVSGATLAADLTGRAPADPAFGADLFVTPKNIDAQVAALSRILGWGISLALQPALTLAELELLLA